MCEWRKGFSRPILTWHKSSLLLNGWLQQQIIVLPVEDFFIAAAVNGAWSLKDGKQRGIEEEKLRDIWVIFY